MSKELTKKDIKEIVIEAIEPFAKVVQKDFQKVDGCFDKIEQDVKLIKYDIKLMKAGVENVKQDVQWMKENSSALFAKLDKFIALYEKHEQELLIFGEQMRRYDKWIRQIAEKVGVKLESL